MMNKTLLALAMIFAFWGNSVQAADDEQLEQARAAAGEVLFQHRCRACHSPDPAENSFGPSLVNVIGREAGSLPRFAYSDAVKDSGIIWSEDNLRAWMADNEAFVPGTRMRHVKITDEAEQDFILAFVRSLER
ncbi:MAG: c-type cytochrome [Pseudomonadota bacterium]